MIMKGILLLKSNVLNNLFYSIMSDSTKKILIFIATSIATTIVISIIFSPRIDSSNIKIAKEYLEERRKEADSRNDSLSHENENISE